MDPTTTNKQPQTSSSPHKDPVLKSIGKYVVSVFARKTPCAMRNEMIPTSHEQEGTMQFRDRKQYVS